MWTFETTQLILTITINHALEMASNKFKNINEENWNEWQMLKLVPVQLRLSCCAFSAQRKK